MKFVSRLACVALIVGLGACKDQGPDRFSKPVDVPLVPEMVAKFSGISYTFANGDFFESRFAGAPMRLTFTSGTTFRAEGNGKVWEGTVTYPTASASGAALRALSRSEFGGPPNEVSFFQLNQFLNTLFWFGNSNPQQNPTPGVGFNTVALTFQSDNSAALRFNNIVSSWLSTPNNFNFQTCVLGRSISVGPYGTTSASYNTQGC
jgi:hypothetical protein